MRQRNPAPQQEKETFARRLLKDGTEDRVPRRRAAIGTGRGRSGEFIPGDAMWIAGIARSTSSRSRSEIGAGHPRVRL